MNYIQNKQVFAALLESEVCIFNPENGEYINLNKTGSEIWHLIEEMNNINFLTENLSQKYKGDRDIIKKNLLEFLDQGIKNGFISRCN